MIVQDTEESRRRAAEVIQAGGIVAFRTDTFYGLGADPFNRDALRRLNELKGREKKPILVVISDKTLAARFIAAKSELFGAISATYWPGPLTIVIGADSEVPAELTAASDTVGLRLPGDEGVRSFIRACGGALTATSANLAGAPPSRTVDEVARFFPTGLDLIVDSGTASGEKPSTVVDVSGSNIRWIREGAISYEQIENSFPTFTEKT